MWNDTKITIIGNLTDDPEIRFTQTGTPVANFTVASTPRVMRDGQYTDGEPTFWQCAAWRNLAENVGETLKRGDRVVVAGTITEQRWTNEDGQKRSRTTITADDVGASLVFASARLRKASRAANASAGNTTAGKASADKANGDTDQEG